jgi:hypothetical protein
MLIVWRAGDMSSPLLGGWVFYTVKLIILGKRLFQVLIDMVNISLAFSVIIRFHTA